MGKTNRKRPSREEIEERIRRSREVREELEERLEYWNARMVEKYGPDYRTPETYEEWLEQREKYREIDRQLEREERPLRRFSRWFRSKAA
jgi:hypothetical protein